MRGPFLQEGRDAFLGIAAEGILDHDVGCLRIGCWFVQSLELVECPLSQPEDLGTEGQDCIGETMDGCIEPLGGYHAVDQSELEGSVPEMGAAVMSISRAARGGITRTSGIMGVVQKRPILTPGVAKAACSEATARSQDATNWQPAAVASPCTRAITGCSSRRRPSITRLHSSKSSR